MRGTTGSTATDLFVLQFGKEDVLRRSAILSFFFLRQHDTFDDVVSNGLLVHRLLRLHVRSKFIPHAPSLPPEITAQNDRNDSPDRKDSDRKHKPANQNNDTGDGCNGLEHPIFDTGTRATSIRETRVSLIERHLNSYSGMDLQC
jgi:hypothetical protein